jgi:CRISPR-associated protein Csh2
MDATEGYTEEDYKKFKEAALIGATALNTNAKAGCENEFAIFIETEEDTYLPNLAQFITFDEEDGNEASSRTLKFEQLNSLLDGVRDKVKNIEIYYNNYSLNIEGDILEEVRKFNIFTRKEL